VFKLNKEKTIKKKNLEKFKKYLKIKKEVVMFPEI
jgi:hypothetical protein